LPIALQFRSQPVEWSRLITHDIAIALQDLDIRATILADKAMRSPRACISSVGDEFDLRLRLVHVGSSSSELDQIEQKRNWFIIQLDSMT
jgi:hypothetical protein